MADQPDLTAPDEKVSDNLFPEVDGEQLQAYLDKEFASDQSTEPEPAEETDDDEQEGETEPTEPAEEEQVEEPAEESFHVQVGINDAGEPIYHDFTVRGVNRVA